MYRTGQRAASRALLVGILALAWLLAAGCDDTTATGDADIDADTDADTDSDTDSDTRICEDKDGDGFLGDCAGAEDCDDNNAYIYPGATELCNGLDDDCDGEKDEGCPCKPWEHKECYPHDEKTLGVGVCRAGWALCQPDGSLGDCQGAVGPTAEECNGLDDDCDGEIDEGVRNACGTCGEVPEEICRNGLDDNCNGTVDEGCDCDGRTHQPCYTGPTGTLGVGLCHGGFWDCVDKGGTWEWGPCEGEVLPAAKETCDDHQDNDCDGQIDEGCGPTCEPHQFGEQCGDLKDNDCDGLIDEGCQDFTCYPEPELCADGLDNDCDGQVDEGCGCGGQDSQGCYPGPASTRGNAPCQDGTQQCEMLGEGWGECLGAVLPGPEVCGDGIDNDCDGEADEGGGIGQNRCGGCGPEPEEVCDGLDNDCDGQIDEGVRNRCGDCGPEPEEVCDGSDNDCDGLIDEGVLNACGKCGEWCYEETYTEPSDWDMGDPENVIPDPDNDGSLTLDQGEEAMPFIWIANTADNQVVKLDTRTGQRFGPYDARGWSPSRTSVALDGSVWVGNRGCEHVLDDCDGGNPAHGNAVHLDVDGNLICRAEITSHPIAVRAVTQDKAGNAWIGAWDGGTITKVSGTEIEAGNPPKCKILQTVDLQGSRAYGAAVDGAGYLWISTLGHGPLLKISTETGQIVKSVEPGCATYGIAIDRQDNPWFGNWCDNDGGAIKVDTQTYEVTRIKQNGIGKTRGVAADKDGNIWVANWDGDSVTKIRASDNQIIGTYNVGNGPLGMAVDRDGDVWAVNYSGGSATKLNPQGGLIDTYSTGANPYSYSDMTGLQLQIITHRNGTWTVDFDSGREDAVWDILEWDGETPNGTEIRGRARAAATRGGLVSAGWSPQHSSSPASIKGEVADGRWIQVEMQLWTSIDGVSPRLDEVRVFWERP